MINMHKYQIGQEIKIKSLGRIGDRLIRMVRFTSSMQMYVAGNSGYIVDICMMDYTLMVRFGASEYWIAPEWIDETEIKSNQLDEDLFIL